MWTFPNGLDFGINPRGKEKLMQKNSRKASHSKLRKALAVKMEKVRAGKLVAKHNRLLAEAEQQHHETK